VNGILLLVETQIIASDFLLIKKSLILWGLITCPNKTRRLCLP